MSVCRIPRNPWGSWSPAEQGFDLEAYGELLDVFVDEGNSSMSCVGACTLTRPVTDVAIVDDHVYLGSRKGIQVLPTQCDDTVDDGLGARR